MTSTASCGFSAHTTDRYRDGDLPDGERRSFEAHLGGCERCRTRLAGAQALGGLLRIRGDAQGESLRRDFAERLLAKLPAERHSAIAEVVRTWRTRRALWFGVLALAAAAAVLVPLLVQRASFDRRASAENEAHIHSKSVTDPPRAKRSPGGPNAAAGARALPAR
ncbi:MAG: anti-sigma factor family protein [Deltaproteobacteria bacterium]